MVQAVAEGYGCSKEHVPPGATVSNEDVEHWCSNSLVPGSRAIQNFRDWSSGGSGISSSGGETSYYGALKIIMYLLETGIPAGYGGMFPERDGNGFPSNKLAVWYVHVQAGGILEDYFESRDSFNPYHLPANGVLERNAYPFLLFEDHDGRLRFGGFGSEWWGTAQFINNAQFY